MKNINNRFKKNDIVDLYIDDNASSTEGIGHIDGYSFFVKDTIKGENIKAVITKANKSYGFAKCIEIKKPSEYRINAKCKYYNRCGGCNLQHMSYDGQLKYKQDKIKNALRKIAGINYDREIELLASKNEFRYRNKAQYPVGYDKSGNITVGFYSPRSHDIVSIDDCLLEPEINSFIVRCILKFLNSNNISAYDEATHSGLIRHIMIRHADKTGEIMVCLVINAEKYYKTYIWNKLYDEINEEIKKFNIKNSLKYMFLSFLLNFNNKKSNVIMGDITYLISGKEHIIDEMNGLKYAISANSFYQVNRNQAEILYDSAIKMANIGKEDIVFDMYCGTGTIGLYMAKRASYVYGVEIVEEAVKMAELNKKLNNIDNIEFFCGSADDLSKELYNKGIKPNVIVIDPPRKGCSMEMIESILKIYPDRLVYISCDVATQARDLKLLLKDTDYKIEEIKGVDQFCQTGHVESVVLMTRVAPTK